MTEFKGRVAVVTGAASGIGRALAERFAEEGMKIVLADVEGPALEKAEAEMKADGADVLFVQTDVSKADDVAALAERTLSAYSKVDVLCNNAGIGGPSWTISDADWRWVLGVNLWGVIHGVQTFVPIMMKNADGGHIVNTASMAAFTAVGGMAPYTVSKHGVVALSECLFHELERAGSSIKVSVLCPGWVNTGIGDSDRNRPGGPVPEEDIEPSVKHFNETVSQALESGLPPKEVAEQVFRALVDHTFYILPHPHWKPMIQARIDNVLHERNPAVAPPPEEERTS